MDTEIATATATKDRALKTREIRVSSYFPVNSTATRSPVNRGL